MTLFATFCEIIRNSYAEGTVMDFGFSGEQRMLRESVIKFMERECPREYIRELDRRHEAPPGLLRKMGEMGWTAIPFPKAYGGLEGDFIDIAIVLEEMGRNGFIAASIYNRSVLFGGMSILTYGNEEQKRDYIPRVCRGEIMFSLALTEPDAGSDAANVRTTAAPDGDRFIINGVKTWITGADVADFLVVPCRTDKTLPKNQGITTFLVDPKSPGVNLREIEKIGNNCVRTYEIFFENVVVPKKNVLGGWNKGLTNVMKTLKYSRAGMSASVTGMAQAAVEDALKYAKERIQFGRPIGKFQAIRHMLADMQMEVDASRLMAYRVAWMISRGLPCEREVAMAKLLATETLQRVSSKGMQILGGYGYSFEFDMQRYFRDGRLYTVGEGTSEIQRNIIARDMGL